MGKRSYASLKAFIDDIEEHLNTLLKLKIG